MDPNCREGSSTHILREQSQYAAMLLYVASVCFSKLSLASFVGYLSPFSQDRLVAIGNHAAVGVWAVIGIFASAFQCHPRPWSYLHDACFNRVCMQNSERYTCRPTNEDPYSRKYGLHTWGFPTSSPILGLLPKLLKLLSVFRQIAKGRHH